jgi:hypothetical protein
MSTPIAPRQAPLILNVVEFADNWVGNATYADAMQAADAAEQHAADLAQRAGVRIPDHELAWIGAEVIMAWNRAAQTEDRRDQSEWLADFQQAGAR